MPPRHDSGHIPLYNGADTIPPSLRNALYSFILACAARRARGDESEHCSMLIHVTRLTAVQQRVRDQVEREMTEIRRRIRYEEPDQPTGIRADLRSIWDADFVPATAAISASDCPAMSWEEINEQLKLAANSIEVKEINGRAGEALDYIDHKSTGLKVIAIGGDKLSRGLTLEGLTCTYFLRASRMYDTLMQMGRWFGYRPRYLDLCRLYTTPDLVDWFGHITDAAQELRQEFEIMANAGASPKDFGLRVRSHPVMMVTSQVKMRHGDTVDVTFNGDICETVNFWRDSKHLGENWSAAVRLIESLENRGVEANCVRGGPQVGAWKWEGGHAQEISAFLDEYQEHNASVRVRTAPLADYVRSEIANGRLVDWTVFVASGDRPERGRLGNTAEFKLVRRSWHLLPRDNEIEKLRHQENNHFRIRRLVDPRDEYVDLSDEQVQVALQQTNRERAESQKAPTTRPSGPNIRRVRDQRKGLLMLYPLDPRDGALEVWDTGRTEPDAVDTPILGFAISFPDVDGGASQVTYVVNNVYSQIDRDYDDEAAGLNDSE